MARDQRIPANYQTVMPYLIIENASELIPFAEKVFGAKEIYREMRDVNSIMHAEIMIGDSTIMFADATEKFTPRPGTLFIYVDNADDSFLKAKEAGATVLEELSDQPYGRSGGVLDPCGNSWWITGIKEA